MDILWISVANIELELYVSYNFQISFKLDLVWTIKKGLPSWKYHIALKAYV